MSSQAPFVAGRRWDAPAQLVARRPLDEHRDKVADRVAGELLMSLRHGCAYWFFLRIREVLHEPFHYFIELPRLVGGNGAKASMTPSSQFDQQSTMPRLGWGRTLPGAGLHLLFHLEDSLVNAPAASLGWVAAFGPGSSGDQSLLPARRFGSWSLPYQECRGRSSAFILS